MDRNLNRDETRKLHAIFGPTTTGETEAKAKPKLHWSERGMKVGDLVGTQGDKQIDQLCDRLFHG